MIFAVTNQKGGVGKTTTVLSLGAYLSQKGKKILLVDVDPQANLTSGLGMSHITRENDETNTVYDILVNSAKVQDVIIKTEYENLDLIPSGIELAGAEIEMVNSFSRESILKKALDTVSENYDFVLIDCPPSLGLLTVNSLVACDKVLIPVQAEYFALEGLGQLINTINLIKSNLNSRLDIGGVIMTMFDNRTNLSKDVRSEIKQFFQDKMFKTIVPRNVKLSEAPSHGVTINDYAPLSAGAKAYKKLTEEFLKRFK